MKLETLTKVVENADAAMGIAHEEGSYSLKEIAYEWLAIITNHSTFLSKPLHLGQFVPCKDGVPLKKPHVIDTYHSTATYREAYEAAEKLVIFEGWDVHEDNQSDSYLVIWLGNYEIVFEKIPNKIAVCLYKDGKRIRIYTISDLAHATQDNPLTLRQ